jgi:prevent-host-death family protein
MQVSVLEAQSRLSELIKSAQAGEEVIIANRGKPIMRLVPIEAPSVKPAKPLTGAELVAWLEARPERSTPRTHDQIEASIQEIRSSWD